MTQSKQTPFDLKAVVRAIGEMVEAIAQQASQHTSKAANDASHEAAASTAPGAGDFELIGVPSEDAMDAGFSDNPEAAPDVFALLPVVAGEEDDGLLLPPAASVEAHYLKNLLQNGADAMVMPIQTARALADLGWCDFQPLADLTGKDSGHALAMLNLRALEAISPDFGVYDQDVFGLLLTESATFSAWAAAVGAAHFETREAWADARNEQASAATFGTIEHGLEGIEALRVEVATLLDMVGSLISLLVGVEVTIESMKAYQNGVKAGLVRPLYEDDDPANDARAVIRCGAEG
ncbi:hypothetical protein [Chitinilyticum litopenaei]|uniref:hypothetical protein n=1 Tax=Chitinilyticum litopenaei TaxID=1121276 RepID=UPI000419DFA0|nr:hypothetical protein [Chitinilyticum litopenaei]